jgi:hypothetical protein
MNIANASTSPVFTFPSDLASEMNNNSFVMESSSEAELVAASSGAEQSVASEKA